MEKVKLYWSNICVMHKAEVQAIEQAKKTLLEKNICLEVEYFGLGSPNHMSEYLLEKDCELPDLLVSTDLEVFEDQRIWHRILPELNPFVKDFSLLPKIKDSNIYQNEFLLPLLVIPMVLCSNAPFNKNNDSLASILKNELPVTFGGINNSGAKSVIKGIWSYFSKEAAVVMMENATILDMPIQGFHTVRTGINDLSIVPYIYAQTADDKNLFYQYPKEGALALPCYAAAFNTIGNNVAKMVIEAIFTEQLKQLYTKQAGLICCTSCSNELPLAVQEDYRLIYPPRGWFDNIQSLEFYELYLKYLPGAFCGEFV